MENERFFRELGAVEVVNYRVESLRVWAGRRGEVDVVVDGLGGKTLEDAWFCVRHGGVLIGIFEPLQGRRPEELTGKVVRSEFFVMKPSGRQLAEVSRQGGGG